MKTRKLRDITVSEIGIGCMGFSHGYGQIPPEDYSIEAIRKAYDYAAPFLTPPKLTARIYRASATTSGLSARRSRTSGRILSSRPNSISTPKRWGLTGFTP